MIDFGRDSRGWFLLAALVWGCASQVPPSGGPPDSASPEVVAAYPAPGTTGFSGQSVALEFSEYVDKRSLQESAFISPSPGRPVFEWDGTEVTISFPETLRPRTTYILTIGTDLRDTRNNPLRRSFSLPFSTGESIDSFSIGGSVEDPSPAGIMIFAYALGNGADPEPSSAGPDYLTQTGADGSYRLVHMKEGRYRLMAVRDVFRNLRYDVQTDAYAMASADVTLGPGSRDAGGIRFRMAVEDTVGPVLSGARAKDRSTVELRFNERVTLGGGVTIADTSDGASLPVLAVSPVDTAGDRYWVVTTPQRPGAVYRIEAERFTDGRGNASHGGSTVFEGGEDADTSAPAMSPPVERDSITGFHPSDTLRFVFPEPVDTAAFAKGLALLDALGAPVHGALRWTGSAAAVWIPVSPFGPGRWYTLSVVLDSVRDFSGNALHDSSLVRRFRIAEEKTFSSISGRARAAVPGRGPIVVEALQVKGGGGAPVRRARAVATTDSAGGFTLDQLPDGYYRVWAFLDLDGDGAHDSGLPMPYRTAEPFGFAPDTLRVRPRWPVEGVSIEIP